MKYERGRHERRPGDLSQRAPEGFLSPAKRLDPGLYSKAATIRRCREAERERLGEKRYAEVCAERRVAWMKKRHKLYKSNPRRSP